MQFLSLHCSKLNSNKLQLAYRCVLLSVRMINYRGLQCEILLILTFTIVPYQLPLVKMPTTGMPLAKIQRSDLICQIMVPILKLNGTRETTVNAAYVSHIGTRFVDPPFFLFSFNSSLLWDVFIINSVEQLQTLPKTQSEIDISPFLKTQKPSSILFYSSIIQHFLLK